MKGFLFAISVGAVCAVGGCAQLDTLVKSPGAAACVLDLVQSRQTQVDGLLAVAKASPGCQQLTADAVQAAVREALLRVK